MLKIGLIEYINALPLITAFTEQVLPVDAHIVFGVPSQLNELLRKGVIDLSMVSSVEFLEGQKGGYYEMLPDYGIGAEEKILSVNLYLRNSLSNLDKAKVGLTTQSATSVCLLKILCEHFWNVSPQFEPISTPSDYSSYEAILLIGDEALQKQHLPGFKTIDLAQAWYYATGLPFVFAVFAVRKEASERNKDAVRNFQQKLAPALSWGHANQLFIEEMACKKCRLPKELVSDYYSKCKYYLGKDHMNGLELFAQLRDGLKSNV